MNNQIRHKKILFLASSIFFLAVFFSFSPSALPDYPLLKEIIITHNLMSLEKSLVDDSYRGEEGILRIGPDIGKSLGMNVYIDQDYLDSKKLFLNADEFLKKAKRAMTTQKKENFPGGHVKRIADNILFYKETTRQAKKKLMAYRSRLHENIDQRMNKEISARVMDRLLEESLKKTKNRLRDALGCFYNTCRGKNNNTFPLTYKNVRFVNHIFLSFTSEVSEKELGRFNLDRDYGYKNRNPTFGWKNVVEKKCTRFIPLVESAIKEISKKTCKIDPLLFIALMKRESGFDPLSISSAGAVGLTQIMPQTGKKLGMKNIYQPPYFLETKLLLENKRKIQKKAMHALFQITEKNRRTYAGKARELMQKSLSLKRKRKKLLTLYQKELLLKGVDDRLKPDQAIKFGLIYFTGLVMKYREDISLALASYNAGPHRVSQFKGLPPYRETIIFRNRVLQFYLNYQKKLNQ